ncbi:gluzincin family metallopeptidase [Gilvimarinus polysaccharolyticus]|uniref:hypothetical protein n=1 Tax=Gilvimarinus polysaccharolyticus TaxID=863921 RepID=UPI0006738909|nr:hypothetical protein [Gilvimarinus polysaccharolyticus]
MSIKPDWNAVTLRIGGDLSHDDLHSEWSKECTKWLESIANEFGNDYRIEESQNFSIMSNESERYIHVFSRFLERTLKRILNTLDGVASDDGYGKHVALIFQDVDQYYEYIGMFFPDEGEFGLSSGMYINEGYGHFVFPSQDIDYAEPIAVHELTHACLAHLPIPLWLNEGIAVLMEDVLAGNHLFLDKEIVGRHHKYWNEETIQGFWSGESFFAIDEGQELSYNLAHILARNISQDYAAFAKFSNSANYADAGELAAQEFLGLSLTQIVGSFLGEGSWQPDGRIDMDKRNSAMRKDIVLDGFDSAGCFINIST